MLGAPHDAAGSPVLMTQSKAEGDPVQSVGHGWVVVSVLGPELSRKYIGLLFYLNQLLLFLL